MQASMFGPHGSWVRRHWDQILGWKFAVIGFAVFAFGAVWLYIGVDLADGDLVGPEVYAVLTTGQSCLIAGSIIFSAGALVLGAGHLHRHSALEMRPPGD